MSANDVRAGKAFVELSIKNNTTAGLKQVGSQLKSFGQTVGTIGAGMAAAGAAITAPLVAAVKHFAEYGSQLNDMSTRTGIGAKALAELGYAAGQTGSDIGAVEIAIKKMQKLLTDASLGLKESADSLGLLGLKYEQLKGQSPEKQFEMIAHAIGAIKDPTERAGAALRVFGKSGTALLPMIEEMDALREKAKSLGVTMDDETVKAADALGDAFKDAEAAAGGLQLTIGGALAPMVKEATEWITKVIVETGKWVRENKDAVVTIAKVGGGLTVMGGVLATVGAACYAAGAAVGVLTTAVGGLGVAMTFLAANPVVLAIAAMTAGVAGLAWWLGDGVRKANALNNSLAKLPAPPAVAKPTKGAAASEADDDVRTAKAAGDQERAEKELTALEEREAAKRRTKREQEIHDIEDHYDKKRSAYAKLIKLERDRGDAADPNLIAAHQFSIRKARDDEDDAKTDASKAHTAEDKKTAEESFAKKRHTNDERAFANKKLAIEVDPELSDAQKKLAKLALDFEHETKEALEAGLDTKVVADKFDLLKKQVTQHPAKIEGTFSAAALVALGRGGSNPAEKQVALAKQADKKLERIATNLEKRKRFR